MKQETKFIFYDHANKEKRHFFMSGIRIENDVYIYHHPCPLHYVDRGRKISHPFDTTLYIFPEKWFCIYVFRDEKGQIVSAYCNINTPPKISDQTISAIDLDLDVLVNPDFSIEILDEDEFYQHLPYYDEAQVKHAQLAIGEIMEMVLKRNLPFSW